MNHPILTVREIQQSDIAPLSRYWLEADPAFLTAMGVDISKMPSREELEGMLLDQLNTPLTEKKSYCIIWLLNGEPVGHSNVNKIIFGQEAYMHLHLWNAEVRKQGVGTLFISMTLPYFFKNLQLQTLYCEPYALNPAPNKTLEKLGFTLVKEYTTTPGWINFEQSVKRWKLSLEDFQNAKVY